MRVCVCVCAHTCMCEPARALHRASMPARWCVFTLLSLLLSPQLKSPSLPVTSHYNLFAVSPSSHCHLTVSSLASHCPCLPPQTARSHSSSLSVATRARSTVSCRPRPRPKPASGNRGALRAATALRSVQANLQKLSFKGWPRPQWPLITGN